MSAIVPFEPAGRLAAAGAALAAAAGPAMAPAAARPAVPSAEYCRKRRRLLPGALASRGSSGLVICVPILWGGSRPGTAPAMNSLRPSAAQPASTMDVRRGVGRDNNPVWAAQAAPG